MPPQQAEGLLDFGHDGFNLGAHAMFLDLVPLM
jgi:hypothetical protein